jgi:Domain of unknown function (DUF4832)/Domain of unknown function (DUF4874)
MSTRFIRWVSPAFALMLLTSCSASLATDITAPSTAAPLPGPSRQRLSPNETNENFANPERGLPMRVDPDWPPSVNWPVCSPPFTESQLAYVGRTPELDTATLKAGREQGSTLIMLRFSLAESRANPRLSDDLLQLLQRDFDHAREAGVKVIPHFAYNYPHGGPDASLDIASAHIKQLAPILERNVDVVAFFDFGLIGCWGENHNSSNSLVTSDRGYNRYSEDGLALVDRWFAALPVERMVTVRYPFHKFQKFNGLTGDPLTENTPTAPVSATEAFNGSMKSRWGHQDDCIACGEWNAGTWRNPHSVTFGKAKEVTDFLAADTRYVVQSGEMGASCCELTNNGVDEDGDGFASDYDSCARLMPTFEALHYTTFNHNDDIPRMNRLKREGCFDEMARRLGYRFVLSDGSMPTTVQAGDSLSLDLSIRNVGYASLYNERTVEVILRNTASGKKTAIKVNVDARRWAAGETARVNVDDAIPSDLPAGKYEVLLNLPDPKPALRTRAEYSIRLANDGWEPETGFNLLGTLTVITY